MNEVLPRDPQTLQTVQAELTGHNQELGVPDEVAADLGYPVLGDPVPTPTADQPKSAQAEKPDWKLTPAAIELGRAGIDKARIAGQAARAAIRKAS